MEQPLQKSAVNVPVGRKINFRSLCHTICFFLESIWNNDHMTQLCSGITCGRVLNGELYAQRSQKLIDLHLFTGSFMKIPLQSSEQIQFWNLIKMIWLYSIWKWFKYIMPPLKWWSVHRLPISDVIYAITKGYPYGLKGWNNVPTSWQKQLTSDYQMLSFLSMIYCDFCLILNLLEDRKYDIMELFMDKQYALWWTTQIGYLQ